MAIGKKRWAIAEGYIPSLSHGEGRAFESHETVCLLNTADEDAQVILTVYFADGDPAGVAAKRTKHVRFDDLDFSELSQRILILPA